MEKTTVGRGRTVGGSVGNEEHCEGWMGTQQVTERRMKDGTEQIKVGMSKGKRRTERQ